MSRLALAFAPREAPLPIAGVVGFGPAAIGLGARALAHDAVTLATLEALSAEGVLVLLGPEAALPWVDGAIYLGLEAPGLYVPTTHAANVPARVLADLLAARGLPTPLAVVPRDSELHVLPLGAARPVDRARLAAFVDPP